MKMIKEKRVPLALLLIVNYIPAILDVTFYEWGALFTLGIFPTLLLFIAVGNFYFSENLAALIFLDINMILAVYMGEAASMNLYISRISADEMTYGVSAFFIFLFTAYASVLSVFNIICFLVRIKIKKIKNSKNIKNDL